MAVTPTFSGTTSDKTVSKFDDLLLAVKNQEPYRNYKFKLRGPDGSLVEETGCYIICDNGYNK